MKTRKNFIAMIMAIVLCFTMVGCANNTAKKYDNGITNEVMYDSYETWEEKNELRLCLDIGMENRNKDMKEDVTSLETQELPKKNQKSIEELQKGMIDFFNERYKVDISEKLEKQKVVMFTATGESEGVMGYVDVDNPDVLNLNKALLKEYPERFETTYIHESLHQIGFYSSDFSSQMIVEGMTDALADMICCYIGTEPVLTEYYFGTRTLAYQLLAADPELVSCYLEDEEFEIIDRINEKLKDVPRKFKNVDNPGRRLDNMVTAMYNLDTGMLVDIGVPPIWPAFEAQEIVKAYCQVFNPDKETIDYIRSHYLIGDYEEINVGWDMQGGFWLE